MNKHRLASIYAIVFIIVQGCFMVVLNSSFFDLKTKGGSIIQRVPAYWNSIINIIIMIMVGVGIYIVQHFINSMQDEFKSGLLQQDLENERLLNLYLRMQRHDFRNHLMVIKGFADMNRIEEIQRYTASVFQEIEVMDSVGKTKMPVLNAFFYSKQKEAKQKGIELSIDILTNLEEFRMSGAELCRILGNILDNAFYEVEKFTDRVVEVDIYEDATNYYFEIYNSGSSISESLMKKIFEPGFTTKKVDGTGMGLYIVKEIVSKYEGSVYVSNQEMGGVNFKISIPKHHHSSKEGRKVEKKGEVTLPYAGS